MQGEKVLIYVVAPTRRDAHAYIKRLREARELVIEPRIVDGIVSLRGYWPPPGFTGEAHLLHGARGIESWAEVETELRLRGCALVEAAS